MKRTTASRSLSVALAIVALSTVGFANAGAAEGEVSLAGTPEGSAAAVKVTPVVKDKEVLPSLATTVGAGTAGAPNEGVVPAEEPVAAAADAERPAEPTAAETAEGARTAASAGAANAAEAIDNPSAAQTMLSATFDHGPASPKLSVKIKDRWYRALEGVGVNVDKAKERNASGRVQVQLARIGAGRNSIKSKVETAASLAGRIERQITKQREERVQLDQLAIQLETARAGLARELDSVEAIIQENGKARSEVLSGQVTKMKEALAEYGVERETALGRLGSGLAIAIGREEQQIAAAKLTQTHVENFAQAADAPLAAQIAALERARRIINDASSMTRKIAHDANSMTSSLMEGDFSAFLDKLRHIGKDPAQEPEQSGEVATSNAAARAQAMIAELEAQRAEIQSRVQNAALLTESIGSQSRALRASREELDQIAEKLDGTETALSQKLAGLGDELEALDQRQDQALAQALAKFRSDLRANEEQSRQALHRQMTELDADLQENGGQLALARDSVQHTAQAALATYRRLADEALALKKVASRGQIAQINQELAEIYRIITDASIATIEAAR